MNTESQLSSDVYISLYVLLDRDVGRLLKMGGGGSL